MTTNPISKKMKIKPTKICKRKDCNKEFKLYKSTDKYCSPSCFYADQERKPKKTYIIQNNSKKRSTQNRQYLKDRKDFLSLPENQICFIEGCNRKATTIEHRAGRIESLLLDRRFWAACCAEHNLELESNPELSAKYQLSKFHEGKKIIKS